MAGTAKLSATMAHLIAKAKEHGGELVRLQGGFWTYDGCPRRSHDGIPVWYAGTTSVQALVTRKMLSYTEYQEGRSGRFPIRARLTP